MLALYVRTSTRSTSERASGETQEAIPAHFEPVSTPERTPAEQAELDRRTQNLAANATPATNQGGAGHAHGGGGHHGHGHPKVMWVAKQSFGIVGYIFDLAWQGLKRWGEMAGKGGGGAKKGGDDHGKGGGGHH